MAALPPTRSRTMYVVAAIVGVIVIGCFAWSGGGGDEAKRDVRAARRDGRGPSAPLVFRDGTWQRPVPGRRLPRMVVPPADGLVRVSGAVIDAATGKTVPDVEVVFADGQTEATTQSDGSGHYVIDVRPGHYRPFVRAEGIVSVGEPPRERLPRRPSSGEVAASRLEVAPQLAIYTNLSGADLEVVRAGVIAGRVFDRDGRPVSGALVRATPTHGHTLRPVLGTDVAETDLDGTFRLELGEAHYVVEAFHDRYGATESTPTVHLAAGDSVLTDLTMVAGCVISGRVVRADGSEPGDGAIERAWSSDGSGSYYPNGSFEEDGSFRWSTTEEGDVVLRAWPWKSPHSSSRAFACRDGARYDGVVFTVPTTGADLGGTILTAGGAPAAHAFIDIIGMSDGTMNQQERADEQGRWEVFALPPGTYQITAYVPGEGATSAVVTSPGSGHTLRLSGSGTLVGRARGITDGTFALTVQACETEHAMLAPQQKHLVTVQHGSYRVDGLPACAMRGEVSNRVRRRPFTATITAGTVTTLDLDLSAPAPKTISGTVRDDQGNLVDGAHVTVLTSDREGGASVTTDRNGRFTITALGGDVLIVGHQRGTAELAVADDDPDTRHVDVTLTPGDW